MRTLAIPTKMAVIVNGPLQGRWIYANWERLGDTSKRYEISNGVLYFFDIPTVFHQWVAGDLLESISFQPKMHVWRAACKVRLACKYPIKMWCNQILRLYDPKTFASSVTGGFAAWRM